MFTASSGILVWTYLCVIPVAVSPLSFILIHIWIIISVFFKINLIYFLYLGFYNRIFSQIVFFLLNLYIRNP